MNFLGYHISSLGYRPEEDKLKVVKDMLPPTSIKEIRSSLGFFNFYKMFIPNYSYYSGQISCLTRKNGSYVSGPISAEAEYAFNHLKKSLLGAPTLLNPDFDKTFFLLTDASRGTDECSGMIGWAVVQQGTNPNDWVPITFGSRVLSKAETNYPIGQLEQLAVIEGYRDNYHILFGHPTSIFCDNKPAVDKATRLEVRMLGMIQGLVIEASSEVFYREGKNQQVPDFLSRYQAPQVCELDDNNLEAYLDTLAEHQENDTEIANLKIQLTKGLKPHSDHFKDIENRLVISKGFVCVPHEETKKMLPLIPYLDGYKFAARSHVDQLVPHLSKERLIQRLSKCVHISNLTKIVKQVLFFCGRCVQEKTETEKNANLPVQKVIQPYGLYEAWHVDFWGPFSDTEPKDAPQYKKHKYYVCGGIDHFSKFMVVKVYSRCNAQNARNFIIDEIIMRYGIPLSLTMDNGTEFTVKVDNLLFRQLGTKRILTSRYNPRANGEIERRWRIFHQFMKKNSANWHDMPSMLPKFLFAVNNSVCRQTNQTPQFMCTGKESNTDTFYHVVDAQKDMSKAQKDTFEIERERLKLVTLLRDTYAKTLTTENEDLTAIKYKRIKRKKNKHVVESATESRNYGKTKPIVGDYVLCKVFSTDTDKKTVDSEIIIDKLTLGIHTKIAPI